MASCSKLSAAGDQESSLVLCKVSQVQNQPLQRASSDVGMIKMIIATKTIIDEADECKNKKMSNCTVVCDLDGAAESVRCECCGMWEDCTPTYIRRIKEQFHGKWICGLCSEAVKEQMKRAKHNTKEQALETHMSHCSKFNRTVRLNPKLSLAVAMRDIARKNSERRTNSEGMPNELVRPISCGPRLDFDHKQAQIQ
ncbi:uncharacterized protein LOC141824660 [Curcuma longa]|uniref:uncharacterized protein LOC141824660 n=1 Tax=Curcuma longa TaxID=136217 RepID=UPI003D9E7EE3